MEGRLAVAPVKPGDWYDDPVPETDDELVCPACQRPYVLHGMACPTLSLTDRSEALSDRYLKPDGSGR